MRISEIAIFLTIILLILLFMTLSILGGGGCSKPEEEKKAPQTQAMTQQHIQASLIETFKNNHDVTIQPQLHQWLRDITQKGIEHKRKRKLIRYRKKVLRRMENESRRQAGLPGSLTD